MKSPLMASASSTFVLIEKQQRKRNLQHQNQSTKWCCRWELVETENHSTNVSQNLSCCCGYAV